MLADVQAPLVIHTPHALPMFREDKLKRSRHLDDRTRVAKAMRPDPGPAAASGPGKGGLIGTTGGTLLTQYILKNQVSRGHEPLLGLRSCIKQSLLAIFQTPNPLFL